jgi:glycosyltransferase involved in cell wall biosynthesis
MKPKLIRITTISESLNYLLKGQLGFLNKYFEVIGVASGKEILNKVSEREGIRCIHIPMKREINFIADIESLFFLIFLFFRERPYIVHANTPKGSLLAMAAAWCTRVPNRIYTVTGLRFETANGRFRNLLICIEKVTCWFATKVIPEGDGVKNTLLKENITDKPLSIISNGNINGIDINFFDLNPEIIKEAEKLRNDDVDFTFVFVGRLVKDKGINELIHAFCRLYEENSKLSLFLVGTIEKNLDPLLIEVEKLIFHHPGIRFVGFQNDIRPFLAASDALVFPSYREGFPNVVLQAGAMGLPSIVTDINGCNENYFRRCQWENYCS